MTSFLRMPLALLHFSFFSGFVMARTMCIAFFFNESKRCIVKEGDKASVLSPSPIIFFSLVMVCEGLYNV